MFNVNKTVAPITHTPDQTTHALGKPMTQEAQPSAAGSIEAAYDGITAQTNTLPPRASLESKVKSSQADPLKGEQVLNKELAWGLRLAKQIDQYMAKTQTNFPLKSEPKYRFDKTGSLAAKGPISNVNQQGILSAQDVHQAAFGRLDEYLHSPAVTPAELWEGGRLWPFPSDHLPAVSEVKLPGGHQSTVASMNLLKEGFDEQTLLNNQGLGGLLAKRHTETDAQGNKQVSTSKGKDFDLPSIRRGAQNTYIANILKEKRADLIGLQEVAKSHAQEIKHMADIYGFTAVLTASFKNSKDPVSQQWTPDLQDYGVTLVDNSKYEIKGQSTDKYGNDSRPDKHITTLTLKSKDSGDEFAFTNTHAAWEGAKRLGQYSATVDASSHIIVGDMNASPEVVSAALGSAEQATKYAQNTPGHVGATGTDGQVVAYDQVHLIGEGDVKEADGMHKHFADYASDYKQAFDQYLKDDRSKRFADFAMTNKTSLT